MIKHFVNMVDIQCAAEWETKTNRGKGWFRKAGHWEDLCLQAGLPAEVRINYDVPSAGIISELDTLKKHVPTVKAVLNVGVKKGKEDAEE